LFIISTNHQRLNRPSSPSPSFPPLLVLDSEGLLSLDAGDSRETVTMMMGASEGGK
jgi:hypothetical protein